MSTVKVGDSIVVGNYIYEGESSVKKFIPVAFSAKVERIWFNSEVDRNQMDLDWASFGKSKVYLDDEGKTWFMVSKFN